MAETIFGHDRLDVYRLAMKFDGVAQAQTPKRKPSIM